MMGKRGKGRRAPVLESAGKDKVRVGIDGVRSFFADVARRHPQRSKLVIVCVGTDRSTGDSFGPWIGTMLRERGWQSVIGTLDRPCDADRYESAVAEIPEGMTVIAFDACLGRTDAGGRYLVAEGPLYPGRATGGNLPPVGDYSLEGIVGPLGVKPYWSLQRASLYEVMGMAREVADAVCGAWPADGIPSAHGF
jgi:putative sporulation protein YyaC